MNRKHNIDDYLKTLEKLKNKKSSIKFSSDFIIAYPGEDDNEFEKTISLMKKVKFINSYSFLYSSRPGTPAADLNEIDLEIAKKRLFKFQKIADQIKIHYRKSLINTEVKVLFENKSKNSHQFFGRDEHANAVIVSSKINLVGKIKKVYVKDCNHNTLFGKLVDEINNKNFAA